MRARLCNNLLMSDVFRILCAKKLIKSVHFYGVIQKNNGRVAFFSETM